MLPGILALCLLVPVGLSANTEGQADMPGMVSVAMFLTFYYMFPWGSSRCGDVNDIIYDAKGAGEG